MEVVARRGSRCMNRGSLNCSRSAMLMPNLKPLGVKLRA
uniref:Uncharacterized protein n=1 Tax=Arundo donax TaxID=35708 RepID=A0A0A8Z614_ARUDO